MRPNGRRAWRAAAKKLRRKMGRRWRSPNKWSEKRWSELVPDLEAHRGHVTGAWFRRHGCTDQGLQTFDAPNIVRVYVGLWGTVDGDGVEYAVKPKPFTVRTLVGMTMGSRKRAAQAAGVARSTYRIGQKLRPCAGCLRCKCRSAFDAWPELGEELAKDHPTCDGSGVLLARKSK